ncbi:Tetraspanin/Peripherin - like 1 [Theobroma cacao]|nr:Tetraspanin/Peripherin - like 1 [Theobroma cacao]
MARCSNIILGILNGFALIIGIGIIAWVISIRKHWGTECMQLLLVPLLAIGIVISVFSLVGLIGACCRSNFYLWIYMFMLAIWIIGLVVGAVFMFYVAGSRSEMQEQGQKSWLQTYYLVGKRWPAVRNCLVQGKICQLMLSEATSLEEFQMENTRHPIQDGCCRPPDGCGFEFKNATFWTVPKTGLVKKDGDCMVWNNQPDNLCFDCDRCKELFVSDLRKDALYFGLMIIGWVIYLHVEWSTECYNLIHTPLFITGIVMFFVSLLARSSSEQAHQNWLKHDVSHGKYWAAVKTCLIDANVCQAKVSKAKNLQDLQLEKTRNPIQDACCRPPEYCEFEFKNATFWTPPKGGVIKRDGNCMAWNNQPDILCFNCDRCKEIIIEDLRKDARYMAIGLTCELGFIVVVCILGCCVRINNNKK